MNVIQSMGVLFSIQTVCIAECVTAKVSKAVVDNNIHSIIQIPSPTLEV